LVEPHSHSGRGGEEKNFLPCRELLTDISRLLDDVHKEEEEKKKKKRRRKTSPHVPLCMQINVVSFIKSPL
jgi:hypothetical protein